MKKLLLYSFVLLLSSCSNPFGKDSLISGISNGIGSLFGGKTSTELVSGGAQQFQTAAHYSVSVSVGSYINQSSVDTNGGYKVITTIKNEN
ncbi:MAG: hypothetical protein H7256_12240 [Bdellovibrio sp.]|nr:hypothetical protein [Bdellovibrio sp.]